MKKLTTEEFIQRSQSIHDRKYDYSIVKYINGKIEVKIICPIHGVFKQIPESHLNGSGCSKCRYVSNSKNLRLTNEEYIKKAELVHGDKYNYSKVCYTFNRQEIEIICPFHGNFKQRAGDHLYGKKGCMKCGGRYKPTTEEFIKKLISIHGTKYNYSKVKYLDTNSKIKIICAVHGLFQQAPNNHLRGAGCPKCIHLISKPETQWLDEQNILEEHRQYKIRIIGKKRPIKVDGYDPKTNTIYEFLGDYFHGNPIRFNSNDMNKKVKKTFGELYQETMKRIRCIESAGYNVKYIWESEYKCRKRKRFNSGSLPFLYFKACYVLKGATRCYQPPESVRRSFYGPTPDKIVCGAARYIIGARLS